MFSPTLLAGILLQLCSSALLSLTLRTESSHLAQVILIRLFIFKCDRFLFGQSFKTKDLGQSSSSVSVSKSFYLEVVLSPCVLLGVIEVVCVVSGCTDGCLLLCFSHSCAF